MLLPGGGLQWKAARAQFPTSRALWNSVTRTRFLLIVVVTGTFLLLWRGIGGSASDIR